MDPIILIGEQAPEFSARDLDGNTVSLKDLYGSIVVLVFWSAECGWCERVDNELEAYAREWQEGVKILWIASNANENREFIKEVAGLRKISPVLLDEAQKIADLYGAMTTPHFFIVDRQGRLAYQGAWNDISLRQRQATQDYVAEVIRALLVGEDPAVSQSAPYGCVLVRYKAGGS